MIAKFVIYQYNLYNCLENFCVLSFRRKSKAIKWPSGGVFIVMIESNKTENKCISCFDMTGNFSNNIQSWLINGESYLDQCFSACTLVHNIRQSCLLVSIVYGTSGQATFIIRSPQGSIIVIIEFARWT